MAKPAFKKGDTFPPLKLNVSDQQGLVDLTGAAGDITLYAKSDAGTITGPVEVIDPPEDGLDEDGNPIQFNARYPWQAGDTDEEGDYAGEVVVEWDSGGADIETFPNGENGVAKFFEFAIVENKR